MDELRIAWVATSGERVGMTLLPGTRTSATGRPVNRDLDADLARISRDAAALVVLVMDTELARNDAADIVERGLRQDLFVIRRPLLPDRPAPTWLMDEIADWYRYGPVVYACTSGRGRSAVAAAWALVLDGASVGDATARIRGARGSKALASAASQASIAAYAAHRARAPEDGSWPQIASDDLRRAHIPPPRAPWRLLSPFALTFDGYTHAGGTDRLAEFVRPRVRRFAREGQLAADLTVDDARACAFAIQRALHWRSSDAGPDYDPGPYADELLFMWALIEHIRGLVTRP